MTKKIWIPIVYVILVTLSTFVSRYIFVMNINVGGISGAQEAIAKANAIGAMVSLIVPIYCFIVLRHLFHKYPPLQILYIVGIIFPVLQGVSYALFSFQDSAAIYLVIFRLIVFISGLIGMILYIVLILHPNTTKPMKIVLFIILISSFVGRVATSIYQWGINFGFVTDYLNAASFMGFFQNGLMVLSTLLTALWFYLILKEEEMSDYLETTQELV